MQFIENNRKTDGVNRMHWKDKHSQCYFDIIFSDDNKDNLYLFNIYVPEKYRNNGFADEILQFVLDYARKENFKYIFLTVEINTWQMYWLERKGFSFIKHNGDDYVWLRKEVVNTSLLVESQGVGMFPYRNVIDEIFDYSSKKVKDINREKYHKSIEDGMSFLNMGGKSNAEKYSDIDYFHIPKEITGKFDFVEDLDLVIHPISYSLNREGEPIGAGSCDYEALSKLNSNGKLNIGKIDITCYYNEMNSQLLKRSFYNNIYHEFNHLYSIYNQLKTKGLGQFTSIFRKGLNNQNIRKELSDIFEEPNKKEKINFFWFLIYRFMSYDEINASIAGVYGELKQLYSGNDIDKLKGAIKKTQAYKEYSVLRKNLPTYLDVLSENEIEKLKRCFDKNDICFRGMKGNFKKSFEKYMENIFEDYLNKIYRAGYFYYDTIQDINEAKMSSPIIYA